MEHATSTRVQVARSSPQILAGTVLTALLTICIFVITFAREALLGQLLMSLIVAANGQVLRLRLRSRSLPDSIPVATGPRVISIVLISLGVAMASTAIWFRLR